ncbi:MAG: RsmG family class I SAM-dependent methyltransferase [Acidimicrobiales bacterium]
MTSTLDTVLDRARSVGFLGPGPIRAHIEHAERYLTALPQDARRMIDLGSGGGIPGLAILTHRPDLSAVLLDAATKRGAFLTWAVVELGMADRVQVAVGRAELLAHDPSYRQQFDVMVSRGFGPPAITLENARGYVRPGGLAIISEPPGGRSWPAGALSQLAFEELDAPDDVAVFRALGDAPGDIPRPHKRQQRSPLF